MNFFTGGPLPGCWVLALPMRVKQGRSSLEEAFGYTNVNRLLILLVLGVKNACGMLVRWAALREYLCGRLRWRRRTHGPRRLPAIGSLLDMGGQTHRRHAILHKATELALLALSLGETRVVIESQPETAREMLHSAALADLPVNQSAQQLLSGRPIGFAAFGDYGRGLRHIAANHMIAPKCIVAHGIARLLEVQHILAAISQDLVKFGCLQRASLNSMGSVFGRRCETRSPEAIELNAMVHEGFELLGALSWADHLPALKCLDVQRIQQLCAVPVPRATAFAQRIDDEHQERRVDATKSYMAYFVDALWGLSGDEKLADEGMIAVLLEMCTDTTAILALESGCSDEIELARLPDLQAVIKETLRLHPPGPLLSWARLSTQDMCVAGHHGPASTTAMVNMYAITHDTAQWAQPESFVPERYLEQDMDVRCNELPLAPFGAGRRVCRGLAVGLVTVQLLVGGLRRLTSEMDSEDPDLLSIYKPRPKPTPDSPVPTAGPRPACTVGGRATHLQEKWTSMRTRTRRL